MASFTLPIEAHHRPDHTGGGGDGGDGGDGNQANGNQANGNQANGNQANGNQANGNQTKGGDGGAEEPCIGPQEIIGTAASDGNRLTWSGFAGADSYHLYRAVGDGDAELLATLPGDTTTFFDDDVEVGTTYTYHVTAVVGSQETDSCDTAVVTAIPVFTTLATGALAAVAGLGSYAFSRRRR